MKKFVWLLLVLAVVAPLLMAGDPCCDDPPTATPPVVAVPVTAVHPVEITGGTCPLPDLKKCEAVPDGPTGVKVTEFKASIRSHTDEIVVVVWILIVALLAHMHFERKQPQ